MTHPTALTLSLVASGMHQELPNTQETIQALQDKCMGAGALITLYREALKTWKGNILDGETPEQKAEADKHRGMLDQLIGMSPEEALAALRG